MSAVLVRAKLPICEHSEDLWSIAQPNFEGVQLLVKIHPQEARHYGEREILLLRSVFLFDHSDISAFLLAVVGTSCLVTGWKGDTSLPKVGEMQEVRGTNRLLLRSTESSLLSLVFSIVSSASIVW